MDNLEKVEKLRERANVTYAEAKEALENSNWDLLDAMVSLEKQGKATAPSSAIDKNEFNTKASDTVKTIELKTKETAKTFGDKLKALLKKSDENHFVVENSGKAIFDIPVWAMILILVTIWEVAIIVFIIGLFAGCKYSFKGPGELTAANKAMNAAEETADSIKKSIENL